MTFTQDQLNDANRRLVTNPGLVSLLADEIGKLANQSSVSLGTYPQSPPDELLPVHIEARLKAARRAVAAAASTAHKLLLLESQFEEFKSLHDRKIAWCAEQNKRAFDTRVKADNEARARAVASHWKTQGAGAKLTQIVVGTERELISLRGCLALGCDLDAWQADALALARRFAAEICEAVEALQPKEAV